MKSQYKQWFLYGTLFSALGFVISGSDPHIEGQVQFSSMERIPAVSNLDAAVGTTDESRKKILASIKLKLATGKTLTPEEAAVKKAADEAEAAKKAAVAPVETGVVVDDTAAGTVGTDATVIVSGSAPAKPGGARSEQVRGTPTAVAPATNAKPDKFDDYIVTVQEDGKSKKYQVFLTYRGKEGTSRAVFYGVTEGTDCPKCRGEIGEVPFKGAADNFAEIKRQLEDGLIAKEAKKVREAKKTKLAKNEDKDDSKDDEEETDGAKLLYKKIDKACKHLDGKAELECKSKRFIETLKASKKAAKGKKKKDLTITDADALAYFDANLKDFLKDMLTHKFEVPQVSLALADAYETRSVLSDYRKDKDLAIKEKTMAKNLIRDLLRSIDGEYKDTRKEISSLYKDSLADQEQEVLSSLRDMGTARSSNDALGFKTSWGSFLENFGFLKSLNTDLYSTMNDSMGFARRNGLVDSDMYRDIMRELTDTRSSVLKDFINNTNLVKQGSADSLDSPGAVVTNALRGLRGTNGTRSATAAPLLRTGLRGGQ